MLRALFVTLLFSLVASAQMPQALELSQVDDLKVFIRGAIDSFESNQSGNLVILNRKKTDDGESFIAKIIALESNTTSPLANEANATAISSHDEDLADDLAGLAFANDILYSKEEASVKTLLVGLPDDAIKELGEKSTKKILDDKVFVVNSHYSLKDYLFDIVLQDINFTSEATTLITSGITIKGHYNPKDELQNSATISIGSLDITPHAKEYAGEYFRLRNFTTYSNITSDTKFVNFNYKISLESLESNIDKEKTLINNFNLDITLGNIDKEAYIALENFGREHPDAQMDDPKLQELSMKFLSSKGIFAQINTLSIDKLVTTKGTLGATNISAKLSLADDKDLAQKIAINPLMALGSLIAEAKIELSKESMQMVMKNKNAAIIGMLPSKTKGDNFLYEIVFKNNQLTVNGQSLGQ